MAVNEQVKEAIDSLGRTFEEFKQTNDERLAQIEAKGSADVITDEKLDRIEVDLDKIEEINQEVTKANLATKEQDEKIARLEKMLSRPLSSKDDATKVNEHKVAFENYLRKDNHKRRKPGLYFKFRAWFWQRRVTRQTNRRSENKK